MAFFANNGLPNIQSLPSYDGYFGLNGGFGDDNAEPLDWGTTILRGFGQYVPYYESRDGIGIISGESLGGLAAEVETETYQGLARTPMVELAPDDYEWMRKTHHPYDGMLGVGDDGTVYAYDGLSGFFKRLFKKVRKGIRKVAKKIRKVAHKIIKRLPGGKMLLKIGGKIKKVAMKIVKPAMKFIGKYGKKLAPIAAMVPGWGTAIAAGLRVASPIASRVSKFMGPGYGYPAGMGNAGAVRELQARLQAEQERRGIF